MRSSDDAEAGETTDRAADVGRAAGRAADRIEDAELTNTVYEAWHEMTATLPVDDPDTTTPAAFAEAAVAAGLDSGDVDGLTGLFREVRYGDRPVTSDREQRAVATLRRIEATYAGEDAYSGTDASAGEGATSGDGDHGREGRGDGR